MKNEYKFRSKKNNILRIIMSVNDEAVIDEINAKVVSLLPEMDEAEHYINTIQIEDDIDVEKLVKEQNYTGIDLEEMNEILKGFDVPHLPKNSWQCWIKPTE